MTMDATKTPRRFRAIIVGGGIAGLSMAHALTIADIDWVLLERREQIAEPSGAGIGIWPHNQPLLEQFGILEELKRTNAPLHSTVDLDPMGRVISKGDLFDGFARRSGGVFEPFLRADLIAKLWEKLPGKESRVKVGCEVTQIKQDEDGVVVNLKDGSSEAGDIVIGADGVHSRVREILWDLANQDVPGTITQEDKSLLTTRYKCLYGLSRFTSIPTGLMLETHNPGSIFHIFTQPTHYFWFLYIKLDKPTHYPERTRYTDADAEKVALEYGKRHVTTDVLFEDIWNSRIRSRLASVEEGVQKKWFWKRVVLVGDAAHKMAPNLAFGANNALESVTVLTNLLQQLISTSDSSNHEPRITVSDLERVFTSYQKQRYNRARIYTRITANYISSSAWETRFDKWMTYLPRYTGGFFEMLVVWMLILLASMAPKGGIKGAKRSHG